MNQSQQQSQLKILIAKGKEQGFLTYAEVNDHLPNDIVDPEQIEDIVAMINDMGIAVHEAAPDADSLLMNDTSVDEDAAEEAAAALASVDSEFGRTTDPVRMYMREMGAVELLTREGEIEIAKRIEDGLKQMLSALATYPATIEQVLFTYSRIEAEEAKLSDLISAFIDPNAPDNIPTPEEIAAQNTASNDSSDDDDDTPADTGPDPVEAKERFTKLGKCYKKWVTAIAKHGASDKKPLKLQNDIIDQFMELKMTPKMVEMLQNNMRRLVAKIRSHERVIMDFCVNKAHINNQDKKEAFKAQRE